MMNLVKALAAWRTPAFEDVFTDEVRKLDRSLLPLQQGLAHSSRVGGGDVGVMMLGVDESTDFIHARVGIFFTGVDAGSCCADDPSPLNEQSEYCEVQFDIDKSSGQATAALVEDR